MPTIPQVLCLTVFAVCASAQTQVTLSTAVSPTSGQPGITSITLTGSNFPAGAIQPASVTVYMTLAKGGAVVRTPATTVTPVVGTTSRVAFIIPASIIVAAPTSYLVSISGATTTGATFTSNQIPLTVNPGPSIASIAPNSAQLGQTVTVTITGTLTNFVQQSTAATFGAGVSVAGQPDGQPGIVTVTSPTTGTVQIRPDTTATPGLRAVTVQTGTQIATAPTGFTVNPVPPPTITSFTPPSTSIGSLVTVTGTNLAPLAGTSAQVNMAKQGGGTISAPVGTVSAASLTFTVPAGATTGPFSISVNGGTAISAQPLTVTPSTNFTLSAAPGLANLIQGQSVTVAASLATSTGFNQLAALSVTGVPSGVTAAFNPQSITAGQISTLTLTAPANQPIGLSNLTVTASATVQGFPVSQSAAAQVSVQAPTTSFLGKTVVSDSSETPLTGVTVSMLGKDGNGNTTGCTGSTVSDGAGNFALLNLSAMCIGPQLVGYNGTTVTSPAGKYAGVNIVYTLILNQVTASPVLVHLPRIDTVETFFVTQNASTNQSYSFASIPGLSVTVYAGTIFTLQDGTKPNPFPLAAVQVPVDRLPDLKPQVPTMIRAFIVAFQPANATTNEPVAVYFPNTLNTPPGTDMVLMTLDPTHGQMVPYGTGSVSSNGMQIVPDADPAHPGHLYGLIHFDWHGPMPPPPPITNPSPVSGCDPTVQSCQPCPTCGQPIDLSSGIDVMRNTDIAINGPRGSVSVIRTFRTMSNTPGPFGIGTNFNYGSYLLTFAFVTGGGPITLVTPDGNQFSFSPRPDGTLTNTTIPSLIAAVITPSGGVYNLRWKNGTVYQYQANGNITAYFASIIDPNGNTISLTQNPSVPGQVTQVTDPVGRSLILSYDASSRIVSVTDPIGRSVRYTYNPAGYLATVTDPAGGITAYAYDAQNNLLTVKNARGILTEQNTYDMNGRVIQQVQADGGVYQFAYTLVNPLAPASPPIMTAVTDPLGRITTYRFTPAQLFTDATDPTGQTKTFTLDPAHGNLVSAKSGSAVCASCGNPTRGNQSLTLDPNGNILTSTDALGNTSTYTYEPIFNKLTSITDTLGDVATNTYDLRGNLLTSTDPNGNTTSYIYNTSGQVTQSTDPSGAKTAFNYDGFGNPTTVTDALGNTTSTVYDAVSRPTQSTDALGRRNQTAYDTLSRIVSQTNAQNNVTHFTYDAIGNLLSTTDARDNTTSFTYDPMNRLLTRTTSLGTSDSRAYDFNGNLITFRDRRGQTSSFRYDSLNRLTSETYADSTVARSYDANSRLLQANDSMSGLFAFAYDSVGRMINSTTPAGGLQYTYDGTNRLIARQVVGQSPVNYTYDRDGNLLNASVAGASITHTYDARNLLVTASRANGVTSRNAYDALGRILSMTHTGPVGIINNQTYAYDSVGNRMNSTTGIAQSLITQSVASAAYDGNNQQNQFGPTTNTFDANGNLASSSSSGGSITNTWDSRNRLSSIITSAGQTTHFTYDFAVNLIQQEDSGTSLNLTKSFVLDNSTNIAYQAASDGTSYSVLSGRSIDSHLAIVQSSGQVQYGLTDATNSTVAAVDQTGAVKSRFLYEAYGQTTATGAYPFQFTGRVPVNSATYYYRARYYQPSLNRFASEDPFISSAAGNLYAYVSNNPLNHVDPLGTISLPPAALQAIRSVLLALELTFSGGAYQCPSTGPIQELAAEIAQDQYDWYKLIEDVNATNEILEADLAQLAQDDPPAFYLLIIIVLG